MMMQRWGGLRLGVALLAMIALPAAGSRADTIDLTGIKIFSVDGSTGAFDGGHWYSTGTSSYELFATSANSGPQGAFINPAGSIDVPLVDGTSSFYLFATGESPKPAWGVDLFLNGNEATPAITAMTTTQATASTIPSFQADASPTTPGLTSNALGASPESLSFTTPGGATVTLEAFSWALPSVYGLDRVSPYSASPDGTLDQVGFIAVTVTGAGSTAVPEPSTIALLGLGLAAVGLRARAIRRRGRPVLA